MSVTDTSLVLESFESLIKAKSGSKEKDVMTQEMIPDNSPDIESDE
tara:strand:+ start:1383 stop:1520 length:138 start_codon:yes stop_codon:yes gene_type:complete